MPWMLLTPPRREPRAGGSGERAPANGARGDAWIVLGDLDAAVYQAGVIDVLLERLGRPRMILAAGMSALNALLALDGRALAFRIGWERVRAAHLLGAAAFERAPLPRLRRNGRSPLTSITISSGLASPPFTAGRSTALDAVPGSPAPGSSATELQLMVDGGFVNLHAGSDAPATAATLIGMSLRQRATPAALAIAIDASVASGAERVCVLGVDERVVGSHEVGRAIEDARTASTEVITLKLVIDQRPGMLGYLLPGLGRTDRLIEAGRDAARRWLAERDGAPGTQPR